MWQNPQFPADLVTFTEAILNGKFHFLCSVRESNCVKNVGNEVTVFFFLKLPLLAVSRFS